MSASLKQKILIVDDEPEAVELVEFNLKQAGYDVASAVDGAEALKKTRALLPSLIVLDVMLPEMDGAGGLQNVAARSGDRVPFPSSCSRPRRRRLTACWGWNWARTII